MPNYDYHCEDCKHAWDEIRSISERDTPLEHPCPSCGASTVKRGWYNAPVGGVDANLTPDKATGGQWSELVRKMKKSPVMNRDAKANLDHASTRSGAKYGYQ